MADKRELTQNLAIMLGFWVLYFLLYFLEPSIHAFIASLTELESEYTVSEQLSKFYLVIIILASIHAYRHLNGRNEVKLSIVFLLLGLIFYMSESNMLTEKIQPLLGLILFVWICTLFLKTAHWFSLLLFLAGLGGIACGVLSDFAFESKTVNSLLPEFVLELLRSVPEERFDLIGIAFICLSAIFCFRDSLLSLGNVRIAALMALAAALIAIGDSFMHYQYQPSRKLQAIALLIALGGFLALMLANRSTGNRRPVLILLSENLFYLFAYCFFIVLPAIHGTVRTSVSLLVWVPFLIVLGVTLWRRHPLHTGRER